MTDAPRPGPFTLAVCAELVFTDLPLVDRLRRLHELGFAAEIWSWADKDLDDLERVRADGVVIESMTGYLRGTLADPDGAAELLATAEESARVATRLGVPRLNVHGTGLDPNGLPVVPLPPGTEATGAMWARAALTLDALARVGERHGVVFELENLNRAVDHPGTPFATAADCLALVSTVDSPHLRLNLDLYHAQIDEGNVVELCRRALPYVGEVQVADVPGRCEPGTGEIHYPAVASALAAAGYTGTVAMEAHAAGDSLAAVEAFRVAFTPAG
ncbi:TIM barrel protein [Agilicoccus flavus]|uniref:TIM barrel protein n=1 Tax=Agilicoccus flavus TaxID=2775968 RepID=UPI001CF6D465|nr:TIM barrel protein [Agilicoccus flavus]